MIITYATHHRWSKPVNNGIMDFLGKKSQSKLRSTLKRAADYNINTFVEPVNEDFLKWFIPRYEKRIGSKSNPNIIPISERVKNSERTYYSLTLIENSEVLGATVFSLPKDNFSIAWRTYDNDWQNANLPANPSTYMEYIAEELATRYNCKTLIHGKDINPYGLNSSIGLAAFKLKVGVKPSKAKKYDLETIDTDTLETDALIFEYPGNEVTEIQKGYLVTSKDNESKWEQVTKYPDLLEIQTIYRD